MIEKPIIFIVEYLQIRFITLSLQPKLKNRKDNSTVHITLLQTDIDWKAPTVNIAHVEQMVGQMGATDLLVLPEMWTTGFTTDCECVEGREALSWMKRVAEEKQVAVCGSVAVEDGGKYFNRCYFVKPNGEVVAYDKHHLFGYGGEKQYYQQGTTIVTTSFRGVRFRLLVCYDLRFPVWARWQTDYDALIVVANWPASRRKVWDVLLRARAIENQCYVIGCNRVGHDPNCDYMGNSCVIDPRGNVIAVASETETLLEADIDMEALAAFREKFNVLDDRDTFILEKQ